MKIWIDLANAPHVLFFTPIIKTLTSRDNDLFVTMRDFNQTKELAERYNIKGELVGQHGGRSYVLKSFNLMKRSLQLFNYGHGREIELAVSHNSYTHAIAGRLIGAKVVTLMDFEGQPANHIAFRLANKVIVPDSFPDKYLKKFGATLKKTYKYKGFKEQVYLSDFKPSTSFLSDLIGSCDLPEDWKIDNTILVVIRTPATMAAYHHFGNPAFDELLRKLHGKKDLTVILLPRSLEDKKHFHKQFPNLKIPKYPLRGSDLVYYADLVISAGGTMNREAAILGTPAYTIFAGHIPAVDKKLIEMERLIYISSEDDLNHIKYEKKKPRQILSNPNLCQEIVGEILN